MTLVELLVALTIFGVVIAAGLRFVTVQNSAVRDGIERVTALQAARFTVETLETDLMTAGTNTSPGQPPLVYAADSVLAFNADYATNVSDDPFAVFYDPDAPAGQVTALSSATTLPETTTSYPDTTYMLGGAISPAELLVFFFQQDTTTALTDDYVLYRQVNDRDPEVIARHLLRTEDAPFFRYMRVDGQSLDSVAESSLPLSHSATIHLSPADTGSFALIDSIRGVRVSVRGTNGRTGSNERTADLTRIIRFPNVAVATASICGGAPILGTTLDAARREDAPDVWVVDLTWNAAVDESGGEKDVSRYVVWRKVNGASSWGDPYLSIPAGNTSYTYTDAAVYPDSTYVYGLAAQDCTPDVSDIEASPPVTIPTP